MITLTKEQAEKASTACVESAILYRKLAKECWSKNRREDSKAWEKDAAEMDALGLELHLAIHRENNNDRG